MYQNNRVSATLAQVREAVQPYLTKRFLRSPYIEGKNVQLVTNLLKSHYSNVETQPKPENGRAMYYIKVGGFLKGGSLSYEILNNGIPPHMNNSRTWVDEFEEYDAITDDR